MKTKKVYFVKMMQFIGNYLYIKYKQNTTLLKNYATYFCQIFEFKLEFALGNVRSWQSSFIQS